MDLEAAVRKHSEMLYRICIVILGSEQDTQDAIQETFCKYLEKKPKFVDGEHEKAWLIKVATNHCRDIQRFRFRHPKVPIEELEYYPPWEPPVSRFRAIRKWYFPPSEPPQHIVAAPIFDFTINLLIVILGELLMQCHQIIYREVFLCLRRQKSEAFWNFWEKI